MKNKRLNDDQKVKWLGVLKNEYMSSEESGPDDTIIMHPLRWRTAYILLLILLLLLSYAFCDEVMSLVLVL